MNTAQRARACDRALRSLAEGEPRALRTLAMHLPHVGRLTDHGIEPPVNSRLVLPDRDTWLQVRGALGTIGASTAGCILSGSFGGGWGVFARWHGLPSPSTPELERGLRMEPVVVAHYREAFPDRVVVDPGHCIDIGPEAWMHSSPDREVVDPEESEPGGMEIKNHERLGYHEWGDGGEIESYAQFELDRPFKPYEFAQVQWQMLCRGWSWVDLVALLPRAGFIRVYRVRRDPEMIAAMVTRLRRWYTRHLLLGHEPPTDYSDGCGRWRQHRLDLHVAGERAATRRELDLVSAYIEARQTAKAAEQAKLLARNELLRTMDVKRLKADRRTVCSLSINGSLNVRE